MEKDEIADSGGEETPPPVRKSPHSRVPGWALGVGAWMLLSILTRMFEGMLTDPKLELQRALRIEAESFPFKVGGNAEVFDSRMNDSSVVYRVRYLDLTSEDFGDRLDEARSLDQRETLKKVCSDARIRKSILGQGLKLRYEYFGSDRKYLYLAEVGPRDCDEVPLPKVRRVLRRVSGDGA